MDFKVCARSTLPLAVCFLVFASGCGTVKASVGPDGTHRITCGNGMSSCISKAEKICRDDGYTIVQGVSRPRILGGASSAYRSKTEMGELDVLCGLPEDGQEEDVVFRLPPRSDEPVPGDADEPAPPAAGSVARACTPGATQACVGPGACQGGQVCREDGKAFGPCDCGEIAPKPSASERESVPSEAAPDGPSTLKPREGGGGSVPPLPGAAPAPTPLETR